MKKSVGVVLGNGTSRSKFDLKGDYILGCNIPNKEFKVDATVICDEEIVWILKENIKLINVPIIISNKAFEKMKELKILGGFNIIKVFQVKDWYSAAHYATEYLIELKYDDIHVWGCDSIFTDDISSTTDNYISKKDIKNAKFISNWRRIWHDFIEKYPGIKIYKS